MHAPRLLRARDWVAGLAPQELAGQREGVFFMLICLVALALITLADMVAPEHATVGAIALLPVGAAAWLLSRHLVLPVVTVAMALQLISAIFGTVPLLTAITQFVMIPVLAFLARVAATGTIRAHEQEMDAREARAGEEKARDLERAKSEFLRLASHELRGPVAILRGYLAMLDEGALGKMPPGIGRVLPVLTATVSGMNLLVEQMLETARLEDSRLQLKARMVDLAAIVRQAANNVGVIHGSTHPLRIRGCDEPVTVSGDPARITTVIGNLVSNAIKYSPPGSDVVIQLQRRPHQVTVAVTDSGIGIAVEDQRRLFARFGRIERPETAGVLGTGLGLYLSRELARLHHGDITVRSRPGAGSTFTLLLPAPEEEPAAAPAPELRERRRAAG